MASLSFAAVSFSYPERAVLQELSFDLEDGELLVLLGTSGSGKSTVLRLAAGLEAPSAGRILLDAEVASAAGRVVLEPARRRTSLVFQDLALWPHLSAEDHLSFVAPDLRTEERRALLKSVGLEELANRLPAQMSGGERQRLALARALASRPRLLLLDEPFASLDPPLRAELRALVLELHRRRDTSTLYVTHDLEDAFHLGDRIAVLNRGKVEQIGSPEEIYRRPKTPFVARFVGKGALVPGRLRGKELETAFGKISSSCPELPESSEVLVLLRPEDLEISEDGIEGIVRDVHFESGTYSARIEIENCELWVRSHRRPLPGESIRIRVRGCWPIPPE